MVALLAGPGLLVGSALVVATGVACSPRSEEKPGSFERRKLDYLRQVTQSFVPNNVTNVIAHMERRRLDPGYAPVGTVPLEAWDDTFHTLAELEDTRDFDALYLTHVLLEYPDDEALAPGLIDKVRRSLLDFKYWYTEPTAAGKLDQSYYWTENHQLVYSTVEYLVGQRYPSEIFTNDGRTGSEHCDSARNRLLRWFDHRSRFGFSEWHSNVYYRWDVIPLLALVDLSADSDVRTLAQSILDILFFDIARHNLRAAFGVTHGRSYKKDKMSSLDEDTWNITKLLFDNTEYSYQYADAGGVLLAKNKGYDLPQAIYQIARSQAVSVDRERLGVEVPETGPVEPAAQAPYGLSFTDAEQVDLWWGMNAFVAWPLVPVTLQTLEANQLWNHPQLSMLRVLQPFMQSPLLAMTVTAETAPMTNFALLGEVNTYTWRSPDLMLSSAVDYRKGFKGAQTHSWQATLDANAIVFTNHPTVPLPESTEWRDDPEEMGGYWNGEASLPRAAQFENVGIYIYAPQYRAENPAPLDMFTYQPFTHAFFPQDRFDEVAQEGHWMFGRLKDGYVALYSYRPAEFINYDTQRYATGGHQQPFDLIASGGADNVWILEGGRRSTWGSFEAFKQALVSSSVDVVSRGESAYGVSPGFDIVYQSPSQGEMSFGWDSPFVVQGVIQSLSGFPRYDDPWAKVEFDTQRFFIESDHHGVVLDFKARSRRVY